MIYSHDRQTHNPSAARIILPMIFKLTQPQSVVDYGCGLGSWLMIAKELINGKILGIDGAHVDRSIMYIESKYFMTANLEEVVSINEKYDLALCLEVAEHISKRKEDVFFESLISLSDTILFSAAIPGQGGQNHFNEQWQEYWANKFEALGYSTYSIMDSELLHSNEIEWWYRQNLFLASKSTDVISRCASLEKVQNRVAVENYIRKLEELQSMRNGYLPIRAIARAIKIRLFNGIMGS